jgi:YD repeat-containing protein
VAKRLLTAALAWFTLIQIALADPVVAISSPISNSRFSAPASITLTAAASDADSAITSVAFYNGATLIGSATQAPYTVTWPNAAAGSYSITAVATNSAGGSTISAPVAIEVKPGEIEYAYDAAGRLVSVIAPDGANAQYGYDAVGNLLSIKKNAAAPVWITGFAPATGSAGTEVTLYGGGFAATPADNTVMFNGVPATVLAAASTSLSVVVPDAASTGKLTLSNAAGSATSATDFIVSSLSPAGGPVLVKVGANKLVSVGFSASAGDGFSLSMSGVSTVPAGGTISAVLRAPDGSIVSNCSAAVPKSSCLLPYLPVSGRYTVTLGAGTSSATASLRLVADTRPGALAIGAAPLAAPLTVFGQAATYTFSETAGQDSLNLALSKNTILATSNVYGYRPDGSQWTVGIADNIGVADAVTVLSLAQVQASGTYKIRIVPFGGATGAISAALTQDTTGTVAVDGTATEVNLTGQNGRYTFSGTVGQWLGLGITGLTTKPASRSVTVTVLKPDGGTLATCTVSDANSSCALPSLPGSGTYTLVLRPDVGVGNASLKLWLSTDATGVLVVEGSSRTFASTRPGQAAAYSFVGTAGQQFVNLATSGNTFPGATLLYVLQPNGTQLFSGNSWGGNVSFALPALPVAGTYVVRILPAAGSGGSITASLTQDVSGTIDVDGAPTAVSLAGSRNGRYTFTGSAAQWLGLGITAVSTTPSGAGVTINVLQPDGTVLTSCTGYAAGNSCPIPALPTAGTYTVVVAPGANVTAASLNLLLTTDASGTLAANGSAQTFASTRAGQAASYTFNGGLQQNLALATSGDTFPGYTNVYVYRPDGTLLVGGYSYYDSGPGTAATLALSNLQAAGPYRVRIVPSGVMSGSIMTALNEDVTGTLAVDGAATVVSLAAQNGRFSFSGAAGQMLGLGIIGLATAPSGKSITISILTPDGSMLASCSASAANSSCPLPALPATGTYIVLLGLGSASSASMNLLLSNDASGTLNVGGGSLTFASSRVGQAATYSFSGTVQQNLALATSGDTYPGYTYAYVYQPDGTLLTSGSTYYGSGAGTAGTLTLSNLPASGTYRVRLLPASGATGSITAALTQEITGTVAIDGAATPVSLVGQNGRFTFAGTVGQWLGLGITGLSTAPSGKSITVSVLNPDGSSLTACSSSAANSSCQLPALPASGTYAVLVSPDSAANASLNLLLSSDASGTLNAGGGSLTFASTRIGQAATYAFSGTVQQNLALATSGDTFPGYTFAYVYQPDGTLLASGYTYYGSGAGTAGTLTLSNLPASGTYRVRLLPPSGASGSITSALTQDVTGTVTVDGAATAVSLTGQDGRFTFPGTAGQWLGLGVTGLSTSPSGKSITVSVLKPDGTSLVSCSRSAANTSCTLPVLPLSGTYTVKVSLGSATGASLNLLLSNDASGTLNAGGSSLTFTTTRIGQASTYTFGGTAGQPYLNLQTTGDTFVGSTSIYVYKPDGTQLTNSSISYSSGAGTAAILSLPALPVTGTYLARIVPASGSTGSITTALTEDVSGTLTPNDPAIAVALSGQDGRFTFAGTAGQWFGLGVTGLTTAPAGKGVKVSVLKPDGSTLFSCSPTAANSSCTLPVLPASGTYTVLLNLGSGASTGSLNLQLSTDVSGTLDAGGSGQSFASSRVGQAALYSFSGTAGQAYLNIFASADTFAGSTQVLVYNPDGTQLASGSLSYSSGAGTSAIVSLPVLPASGTYLVRIVPPSGVTGAITAALTQDVTGTLQIDAPATVVNVTGRDGSYTFDGTAGQWLGLGVTGLVSTPSGIAAKITILKPDGTSLVSCSPSAGNSSCTLPALPGSGVYTVLVSPGTNASGVSLNVLLSQDASGILVAGDPGQVFTSTRVGQAASYNFSGAAQQSLKLVTSTDIFSGTTTAYVYKPDGSQLTSGTTYYSSGTGTGATLTLPPLPVAGTYTVRIVPPSGKTGSIKVALSP